MGARISRSASCPEKFCKRLRSQPSAAVPITGGVGVQVETILTSVSRIAWFISPHGFGHAARSSAMMDEVFRQRPDAVFEIFTTVPEWFFSTSLVAPFHYNACPCDVGLVQRTALEEDVEATVALLAETDLLAEATVEALAAKVLGLRCQAVVADIAPQGLAVARKAGLPAVLVENFTWDWIYRAYGHRWPAINRWADAFEAEFSQCDLRIQAEPWCLSVDGAVRTSPISRKPGIGRDRIRAELGIEREDPMLLVSMGGIPWHFSGLEKLAESQGVTIVVPGGGTTEARMGSLIVLPHHSRFHHPDLVHAADGVLAKLGYSTVAEVWAAGCSLGWIGRSTFAESAEMARWVRGHIGGAEISQKELIEGRWVDRLGEIVTSAKPSLPRVGGAPAAAAAVLDLCVE